MFLPSYCARTVRSSRDMMRFRFLIFLRSLLWMKMWRERGWCRARQISFSFIVAVHSCCALALSWKTFSCMISVLPESAIFMVLDGYCPCLLLDLRWETIVMLLSLKGMQTLQTTCQSTRAPASKVDLSVVRFGRTSENL